MKTAFLIGLFVCAGSLLSQELVPNPSFEQLVTCPENATPDVLDALENWTQPGEGTPDVFNACSRQRCHPNRNFAGNQSPAEGKGYAGLIAFSNEIKTYREYLQVPLRNTLQAGKIYQVVLHVSLSDYSGYAVSNLGCGFHPGPLKNETTFALTPQTVLDCDTVIKDTSGWTQLVFNHTARGNEAYFLVGNFRKYHEIKKIVQVIPAANGVNNVDAYYYIDRVSVSESEPAVPLSADEKKVTEFFTSDSTLVLNNLEFGYDSYELSETDRELLAKVAGYFKTRPQYCLTVAGHTDARGSFTYNNELSVKRAEAVSRYLESRGLSSTRLTPVGFGYTQPVDKDLKSARNRRVEIRLKKCAE